MNRNYFGRQTESFEADLDLPFLSDAAALKPEPFRGVFIRAPVVEKILAPGSGRQQQQKEEASGNETVIAPSREHTDELDAPKPVEVMATLPGRSRRLAEKLEEAELDDDIGDIVAVRQRNVFATSFHPELTPDARIHGWWLRQVLDAVRSADSPQAAT